METSFPDRYNVLKKNFLIKILLIVVFLATAIGCDPTKELTVEPVPIFSKVLNIDSAYTTVSVISTGNSSLLFCGKKDNFDSYSILKFDSLPESFDSLFVQLTSGSASVELTLYEIQKEWSEDSVYLWNDIGSLIDTLNPLLIESVNDSNPRIFIGSSSTLDYSVIENISNFGLAFHAAPFYSFNADEAQLELDTVSGDTLENSIISCSEDAFIVKNPFQDSIFYDSLLIGRGILVMTHIFIPRDSLPSHSQLNAIAKAEMVFDITDSIPFGVRTIYSSPSLILYKDAFMRSDSLKFDLTRIFRSISGDSVVLEVEASQVTEGIGIEKLGDGEIRFVWVEFPR
ncbi:MAG: hypothetical protein P8Z50_01090 [candidate division WOR-3 bacterium]